MSWRKGERPTRRHWSKTRLLALDRASWRCQKCGKYGARLEIDHIKPLGDGGALYDLDNLQALCRFPCHFDKTRREQGAKEPDPEAEKWRRYMAQR